MNSVNFKSNGKIKFTVKPSLLDRVKNAFNATERASINMGQITVKMITLPFKLVWFFMNRSGLIMDTFDFIKIHFKK